MKISITVMQRGNASVRGSINGVIEKIPSHWKELLPIIHFSAVALRYLPKKTDKIWGIGAPNPRGIARRNWSIRIAQYGEKVWKINIFLLGENDMVAEYLFRKDLLSAIFTTTLKNKAVMEIVKEVAKNSSVGRRVLPHSLLTHDYPSFLLNPETTEETQPDLFVFFFRLEKKIQEFLTLGN